MKYAVITGTSRGLGASIAALFLKQGVNVIGISRNENNELANLADENNVTYQHYTCHLANVEKVDKVFSIISDQLVRKQTSCIYFIHNAGTVNPINTAENYTAEAIDSHVHVNLIAPMIASSIFLKAVKKCNIPLINVYVTSGAANRSVYGWSAYSATKAGLNRYARTLALEQEELNTNSKAIIFDPSIMDTGMQNEIRSTSKEAFQDVEQFQQYKREDQLRNTNTVAEVLIDILIEPAVIENGKYYSVKDIL
ncbi:Benzil reductase ((S)-benzoin forming) [Paraliobacillus sp. PM-2]|uniref:(S)-benzoin forming benzil reductase n=1 Tax=Paraliobacillus sp. PM-2 TaxID=1462524 RepID=UPI00061CBB57|nr:(S)-benzoin forming benzil reductase [Paraliobacillus sp. PM-2]CQR47070.1 Benzil reductase ((S)-benzoin forming) [Paraliobacillus sp. PM-2]